jgi:hypothetical protein
MLFLFAGPLIAIVRSLTDSLCMLLAGFTCYGT